MAYFRKLKLDPNFEDWLDSRIIKLKAEGVIESDQEEEEEQREQGEHWEEEISEEEQEFVWGEDPVRPAQEQEVPPLQEGDTDHSSSFGHDHNNMATVSAGGKIQTVSGTDELTTGGTGDSEQYRHISTEIGGDYYQFVWEDDDEADIFDREEYKLGHTPSYDEDITNGVQPDIPGDSRYEPHIEPRVRVTHPSNHGNHSGDTYQPSSGNASSRLGSALSGLVLGVANRDVQVAYTKLQGVSKRPPEDPGQGGNPQYEKDWDFEVQDDLSLPDPRFSISVADQGHAPNDVPMLELPPPSGRRRKGDKRRSARVRDADARGTASSGLPEGDTEPTLQERPGGGAYGRDRILLPMDTMEMTMTSDDDDDAMIDDDYDVRSELAPDTQAIVTVDQATLVEQWRSKSKRTRLAIMGGIVGGVLLLFGIMTYLVVHILTGSW